ncbi:MAG TPA: hypothetical protein VF582_01585 [Allosphingosinicella sp.]|jgi:hypothetical protein
MENRFACLATLIALGSAAPAAAQVKCIALPLSKASVDAGDPGARFSNAVVQARACADAEAYKLASGPAAPEEIGASVAERCKGFVEAQARYAIAANLGWTRDEISKDRLNDLREKAAHAVKEIRAGACPVTMKPVAGR